MLRPRLLILDEPIVGLDLSTVHVIKGYLSELCQSGSEVFFSPIYLKWQKSWCGSTAELIGIPP